MRKFYKYNRYIETSAISECRGVMCTYTYCNLPNIVQYNEIV